MRNTILILSTLTFIACGGEKSSNPTPTSQTSQISQTPTSQTRLIDEDFTLKLSDVPNYKSSDSIEKQYLSVINYLRSLNVKCNDHLAFQGPAPKLTWNNNLADASQEHSNDMLSVKKMSHTGSGTSTDLTGQDFTPTRKSHFNERIRFNHYDYKTSGENVAYIAKYPILEEDAWVQAMENLMKSKTGHCSNIMNADFKDFAMAEARGTKNLVFSDGVTRPAPAGYWTQNFGALK